MKNLNALGYLLIVAASLLFIQCTSDPIQGLQGVPGTNGINGIDGINGVDGADGSAASCIACHSNEHRDPIRDQYAISHHATSPKGSWAYAGVGASRVSCARCHNNQGFSDFISTGEVIATGYTSVQPITCTGCHASDVGHRSFDFANDGNDYALRTNDPVTLIIDPTYTIDIRNESDLLGLSNTCVNCHQPRTHVPTVADAVNGKYMITSTHWGTHHGPQVTMLEGINGGEIAGSVGYPTEFFPHRSQSSCVKCHMSPGTDATNGGHTFNPTRTACTSCHLDSEFADATTFDREGFQTETMDRMEILAGLLANVVGQDIAQDSLGVWQPVYEADGFTPVTHVGIVIDGSPVIGLYDFTAALAAWNYVFIEEDSSKGVHNPAYVDALIPNSIEALQN
jgi:hypothetical protein